MDLGDTLAEQVLRILESFVQNSRDIYADVPRDPAATDAAARWADLDHPNSYAWHTQLTADEFHTLRELSVVFGIFFGPRTPEELCRIGGFELTALRRQFWETLERAQRLFG